MGKDQELLEAARNGCYAAVEKILLQRSRRSGPLASLRRGPGPNIQDPRGYTALHNAALHGHRDVVALLMAHEASVNLADVSGSTPLHLAAWTGNVEVVRTLITHGPGVTNVDCVNKDHETPLHSACQYGHTPVVRLLLEHCCDAAVPNCRGETPLDLASQYGRLDVVELLVRVRPSLLEPYRPDAAAAGERLTHTPLHSAAMNGHRAVVALLVESGMDVNCTIPAGTALFEAALCGKVEVVRYLLEAGVDTSIVDSYGRDVLTLLTEISTPVTTRIRQLIQGRGRLVDVGVAEESDVPSGSSPPLPPIPAASPSSPYENVLVPTRPCSAASAASGRAAPSWPLYDVPPPRRNRPNTVSKSSDELNGIEFDSPVVKNGGGAGVTHRAPMLRSHSYDIDKISDTESDPPSPPPKARNQSTGSSADGGNGKQQSAGSSMDGSIGRLSGHRVSARIRSLESDPNFVPMGVKPMPPPKPPRRSIASSPPNQDNIYELLSDAKSCHERLIDSRPAVERLLDSSAASADDRIGETRRAYENVHGFWRRREGVQQKTVPASLDDIAVTSGRVRVKDRRRNRTNVYENYRPGDAREAAPVWVLRRPEEQAEPRAPRPEPRLEPEQPRQDRRSRSPRPMSVSAAGVRPVPPPRISSRLKVHPLSPTHYQQPPTPDHPPPTARQAEEKIAETMRPISQESSPAPSGSGGQRSSRDMETETDEDLLAMTSSDHSSASASAAGSDVSASTDNIEEVRSDAPFAGLYRGSTIGLLSDLPPGLPGAGRRPERPTTLPARYENVRLSGTGAGMSTSLGGGEGDEPVLRRPRTTVTVSGDNRASSLVILSPFNEQEEWNKVYDIVASYGDGIMSEIDQELQSRRGQTSVPSDGSSSRLSAGGVASLLQTLSLSRYEQRLIDAGFDDVDFLRGILDDADLREAGVVDEEQRAALLVAVSHLPDGLARARRDAAAAESVPGWLRALRLEQYADVFSRSLYTEMARVRRVWEMELVTVLEVTRPGHLKRMLLSLQPPRTEAEESQTPGPDPGAEFSDLDSTLALLRTEMEQLPGSDEQDRELEESLFKDYTLPRPEKRTNGHGGGVDSGDPAPPVPPAKPRRRRAQGSGSGSDSRPGEEVGSAAPGDTSAARRRKHESLQIRDPSQLVVGVPAVIATQWRHEPHHLVNGSIQYIAEYLGSTLVKEVRGTESTRKSIQKLKKKSGQLRKVPRIVLSISHTGVKFLDAHSQKLVCEHEIRNIHCACQDADDLSHFAYITKDLDSRTHYCHVFRVQSMDLATEIILTLGQAFEVAYQLAIRQRSLLNQSDDSKLMLGHQRSQSANHVPRPPAAGHARSHSVNQITAPLTVTPSVAETQPAATLPD